MDNIYKATSSNGIASIKSIKSRSAATSPTGGASLKNKHVGSLLSAPGIAQKNVSASTAASPSTNSSPRRSSNNATKTSNEAWVCPSDRQLALRAK